MHEETTGDYLASVVKPDRLLLESHLKGTSMDWRLKCLGFYVLKFAPRSAYDFLQRHVTGRYFLTLTDENLAAYGYHTRNFRGGRALEFGAGPNLISALLLSQAGATEVLAYDIERVATVERVNDVLRQLRERGGEWPEVKDLDKSLLKIYRIRYCAPADARCTRLPAASVNFFYSTSTLEHIPIADIERILEECLRVAAPGALMSCIIDYHDHYSTADPSIPRMNFYRYPNRFWKPFNPSNHYQNRLRHSDYIRLFSECRWEPLIAERRIGQFALPKHLASPFRHYSHEDLTALNGFFVLRGHKPATENMT